MAQTARPGDTAKDVTNKTAEAMRGAAGKGAEMMRDASGKAAELSKLYADLLKEQAEHSLQAAKALGKTFDWNEAIRVQSEFMRTSFERMSQLQARHLELVQAAMSSATSTAKDQSNKAS